MAEDDIEKGQKIGLKMKAGLLLASQDTGTGATGIAVSKSKKGTDVGVTGVEGIVPLKIGKATILRVPAVQRGGSGKVDFNILKKHLKQSTFVAAIGLESFVCLRQANVEF